MVRSDGTTLGSIRGIADPTYRAMIVDATGVTAGFNVRTRLSQGPTSIGGINDKYAISCVSNITTMQYLNCVADPTYNGTSQLFGLPMLVCDRYSTADTSNTGGSSPIARFVQAVHKENENIVIHLGAKSKSIMGALGYNLFTDSANDRLWLGFTSASSQTAAPTKNLLMDTSGNVTVPLQLTAGTISATTYVGLPPVVVPSSELLPITLDKVNNRVGINNTTPTVALDLTGDISLTGRMATTTTKVCVGSLAGSSAQGTNTVAIGTSAGETSQGISSVAIGQNAGQTSQGMNSVAVGVTAGNSNQSIQAVAVGGYAGQTTQGSNTVAIGYVAGNDTQGANSVAVGAAAGNLNQSANSVAIGLYAGQISQGSNCVAVGNSAGQTNQHANSIILNATGSALNSDGTSRTYVAPVREVANNKTIQYNATTKEVTYADTLVTSGAGNPEGVVTAPVGRLYLRTDGGAGTTMYLKESGTGNTGWGALRTNSTPPSWSIYRGVTGGSLTIPSGTVDGYTTDLVTSNQCIVNKSAGSVTISVSGRYYVSFFAFALGGYSTTYECQVEIRVNGVAKNRNYTSTHPNSVYANNCIGGVYDFTVNDVVTVYWGNFGSSYYPDFNCTFSGYQIR